MPSRPSKRSKVSSKGGGSSKLTELATEVTVATLRHKRGIAALPSELLLEIVSYFTEISIADIRRNPRTLPVEYRERFSTLKALSQTCKDLRSVCLPLAWERLEACTTAGPSHMFYREVGVTLERKCSGLLKSKHLLSYIRCVLKQPLLFWKVSVSKPAIGSSQSPSPDMKARQSFRSSQNVLRHFPICIQSKSCTRTHR